jgi:hypothetical protein
MFPGKMINDKLIFKKCCRGGGGHGPPLWSNGRVPGYRYRGPVSIPGTTRKKSIGSGTGCTQPREYKLRSYLIEK